MPPKKKAPEKNPAEAAAEEAMLPREDTFTVSFRGEEFTFPRARLTEARFVLLAAAGRSGDMMLELIGPQNTVADLKAQNRFLATLKPGETLMGITEEFFAAVNEVTGSGNS